MTGKTPFTPSLCRHGPGRGFLRGMAGWPSARTRRLPPGKSAGSSATIGNHPLPFWAWQRAAGSCRARRGGAGLRPPSPLLPPLPALRDVTLFLRALAYNRRIGHDIIVTWHAARAGRCSARRPRRSPRWLRTPPSSSAWCSPLVCNDALQFVLTIGVNVRGLRSRRSGSMMPPRRPVRAALRHCRRWRCIRPSTVPVHVAKVRSRCDGHGRTGPPTRYANRLLESLTIPTLTGFWRRTRPHARVDARRGGWRRTLVRAQVGRKPTAQGTWALRDSFAGDGRRGKDSTISHVMSGEPRRGVPHRRRPLRDLADFLWRTTCRLPSAATSVSSHVLTTRKSSSSASIRRAGLPGVAAGRHQQGTRQVRFKVLPHRRRPKQRFVVRTPEKYLSTATCQRKQWDLWRSDDSGEKAERAWCHRRHARAEALRDYPHRGE